jgi:hypothetical protein
MTPSYDKIKALQPQTKLRRLIATNIKEYLLLPAYWLFTLFREKGAINQRKAARGAKTAEQ